MSSKQYGPTVICTDGDRVPTHRPGNDGPFFCIVCGAIDHRTLMTVGSEDLSDLSEYELSLYDISKPYSVTASPYGETVTQWFATEAEAAQFAIEISNMAGQTYSASWGEQPVNTETTIRHHYAYKITDKNGELVKGGDTVTDFRGDKAAFVRVTRAAEPGRSAKVEVLEPAMFEGAPVRREYYATVFNLTITTR